MVKYFSKCNYCNREIDDWLDNPPVNIFYKNKLIWSYHRRCLDKHFFKKTKVTTKRYLLFFIKKITKNIWKNKLNPEKKYKVVFIDGHNVGDDW